jgi:hypothetical protein
MDAYHLPNSELDKRGLRSRKGRIETFHAAALAHDLQLLRDTNPPPPPQVQAPPTSELDPLCKRESWAVVERDGTILYPVYDRAVTHDPVLGALPIVPNVSLVFVEGLYVTRGDGQRPGALQATIQHGQRRHALQATIQHGPRPGAHGTRENGQALSAHVQAATPSSTIGTIAADLAAHGVTSPDLAGSGAAAPSLAASGAAAPDLASWARVLATLDEVVLLDVPLALCRARCLLRRLRVMDAARNDGLCDGVVSAELEVSCRYQLHCFFPLSFSAHLFNHVIQRVRSIVHCTRTYSTNTQPCRETNGHSRICSVASLASHQTLLHLIRPGAAYVKVVAHGDDYFFCVCL